MFHLMTTGAYRYINEQPEIITQPGIYNFYAPKDGWYYIELVGGGGGASGQYDGGYRSNWTNNAGGSGAVFKGNVYFFKDKLYKLVVGSGGLAVITGNRNNIASNGEDTILYMDNKPVITCGGGKGAGYVLFYPDRKGWGGTINVDNNSYIQTQVAVNGNTGMWGVYHSPGKGWDEHWWSYGPSAYYNPQHNNSWEYITASDRCYYSYLPTHVQITDIEEVTGYGAGGNSYSDNDDYPGWRNNGYNGMAKFPFNITKSTLMIYNLYLMYKDKKYYMKGSK